MLGDFVEKFGVTRDLSFPATSQKNKNKWESIQVTIITNHVQLYDTPGHSL